jgi:hypothetical protein
MAPATEHRPAFAEGYPRDPALDALVEAFERGDFGHVRVAAPRLAETTRDPIVKQAALDLRARIEPDPMARWVVLGTGALLAFLVFWFYSHRLP